MSQSNTPSGLDAPHATAIAWLVRVQSDHATADDWRALTDWLEESDDHQAAFDAVERLSASLADQAGEIAQALSPASADILSFQPRRRRFSAPWGLAAAAAAAAVVITTPVAWSYYQGVRTVYQTAKGETRQVVLADGTRIRLDSASKITVRLGWRARRVEMADAEASFDVAKDAKRPFLIAVGDQQVRVVGTEFNIRHYDRRVVLTVRRGVVEVRQPARGPQVVARLTVGEALDHAEGAPDSARSRVDPNRAFAWTTGRLIYEDQPLSAILADLNRHYPVPIQAAAGVENRRFSGVLELGDQDNLVARLAQYLSLAVNRANGKIILS